MESRASGILDKSSPTELHLHFLLLVAISSSNDAPSTVFLLLLEVHLWSWEMASHLPMSCKDVRLMYKAEETFQLGLPRLIETTKHCSFT